jgi:hypothetical protein
MGEACSTNGRNENLYKILAGKETTLRPMWDVNITMNLREVAYEGDNRIG